MRTSSIRRIDRVAPVHGYLMPMLDDMFRHPDGNIGYGHFGIVALRGGKWSTDFHGWSIALGKDVYGRKCVFGTREEALRAAVARFIKLHRSGVRGGYSGGFGPLRKVIPWALSIAPGRHVYGLPLLDWRAA